LWRFLGVSKFPERAIFPGVCFTADAFEHGKQRNIAMTITYPRRVRNTAAALALALIAGPAIGAPTGSAPATAAPTAPTATTTMPSTMPNTTPSTTPPDATTPDATMPNSNPYTAQQGVSPNGTPVPDTANQYQQPSPLTPQQRQKQAVCPPNAASTTTTPLCVPAPGTTQLGTTTPTPPPCMPGQVPCP
jgi:hypothetical protein